jgi:hypothetical protein
MQHGRRLFAKGFTYTRTRLSIVACRIHNIKFQKQMTMLTTPEASAFEIPTRVSPPSLRHKGDAHIECASDRSESECEAAPYDRVVVAQPSKLSRVGVDVDDNACSRICDDTTVKRRRKRPLGSSPGAGCVTPPHGPGFVNRALDPILEQSLVQPPPPPPSSVSLASAAPITRSSFSFARMPAVLTGLFGAAVKPKLQKRRVTKVGAKRRATANTNASTGAGRAAAAHSLSCTEQRRRPVQKLTRKPAHPEHWGRFDFNPNAFCVAACRKPAHSRRTNRVVRLECKPASESESETDAESVNDAFTAVRDKGVPTHKATSGAAGQSATFRTESYHVPSPRTCPMKTSKPVTTVSPPLPLKCLQVRFNGMEASVMAQTSGEWSVTVRCGKTLGISQPQRMTRVDTNTSAASSSSRSNAGQTDRVTRRALPVPLAPCTTRTANAVVNPLNGPKPPRGRSRGPMAGGLVHAVTQMQRRTRRHRKPTQWASM